MDTNDLPFSIERQDNHLLISAKADAGLTDVQRKNFEENKAVVSLVLFDDAYFNRMNKINIDFKKNVSLAQRLRALPKKCGTFIYNALTAT